MHGIPGLSRRSSGICTLGSAASSRLPQLVSKSVARVENQLEALAGEQRRGFAGLAGEVRKLAARTTASAQELRRLAAQLEQARGRSGLAPAVAALQAARHSALPMRRIWRR